MLPSDQPIIINSQSSFMDASVIVTGIQDILILATLIFMYYQYKKTISILSNQLSVMTRDLAETQKQIRIATHEDMYEKLFTLYYKYIDHADDLKDIFLSHQDLESVEIKRQYIVFVILDILYLMYLQRNTLDKGLMRTWKAWVKKIFEEPQLLAIYENIKKEYDVDYTNYIENLYKSGGLVND